MTGSTLGLIVLAAWLVLVFYADAHPAWRGQAALARGGRGACGRGPSVRVRGGEPVLGGGRHPGSCSGPPVGTCAAARVAAGLRGRASAVLACYGAIQVAAGSLVLSGAVRPAATVDWTALRWHVLVRDMWFLFCGILLAPLLRRFGGSAGTGGRPRAWPHGTGCAGVM